MLFNHSLGFVADLTFGVADCLGNKASPLPPSAVVYTQTKILLVTSGLMIYIPQAGEGHINSYTYQLPGIDPIIYRIFCDNSLVSLHRVSFPLTFTKRAAPPPHHTCSPSQMDELKALPRARDLRQLQGFRKRFM